MELLTLELTQSLITTIIYYNSNLDLSHQHFQKNYPLNNLQ